MNNSSEMPKQISIKDLSDETDKKIDPFSLLETENRNRLMRAAETNVSILLTGETGTGKGQLARAIVEISPKSDLVEVNCAAFPEELLGSELFGHKKGAFTGATSDRKGILQAAADKTVFLDEIGEISPQMQRMLLRVVQRSNRIIKPLGSDSEIPLQPMRFIFATNRNLEFEVRKGTFREDLLRRIDVVSVSIPPLRERPELIPGYIGAFVASLSEVHRIKCEKIDQDALTFLIGHRWSGNVRELKNAIERALVTAPRPQGYVESLGIRDFKIETSNLERPVLKSLADTESDHIKKAIKFTSGNLVKTMKVLGLSSRSALYGRLKKYNIDVELAGIQEEE
ncbi:MAG: sigma-54-dependent Fis family transcriptional regulator [Candidatus Lindowbacteria bacterium]|nr:sigma-54-dependent Fis family transcriptional regulator [Candidatus Lindowbacteria bacterium]